MSWDYSVDDIFYTQLKFKYQKQRTTIKILDSEIKTLELKLDRLSYDQAYIHGPGRSENLEIKKVIKYLKKDLILLKKENEKLAEAIFGRTVSYNTHKDAGYYMEGPSQGARFYSSKYEKLVKKYKDMVCLMEQKIKELTIKIDKENEKLLKKEKKNIYKLKQLSDNSKQR